ncbi:MAG: hypothetical protein ACYTE5_06080 [Planctomycetota bacterium]
MKAFITALTITITAFPGEDPKSATNPTVSTFRRTRSGLNVLISWGKMKPNQATPPDNTDLLPQTHTTSLL